MRVRRTGDQEAAGSTTAGSTFFVEINYEIFSMVNVSFLIQEGQLSVSGERIAQYWITA